MPRHARLLKTFAVLALAGCSATSRVGAGGRAEPDRIHELRADDPWPDLRKQMAIEPLDGYAWVAADVVLDPKAPDAAQREPVEANASVFVQILEDHGDVVKVRSTDPKGYPPQMVPLDGRFALIGFVRRDELHPVLRVAKVELDDDGTGYALSPGTPVDLGVRIRLTDAWARDLEIEILPRQVGLSFTLADESDLPDDGLGEALGCHNVGDWWSPQTVVKPREELQRDQAGDDPYAALGLGMDFRCRVVDIEPESEPEDDLVTEGYEYDCSDGGVWAYRAPATEGKAIVEYEDRRGRHRVIVDESQLIAHRECASGSIGTLGAPPKVWGVPPGAPIVFEDGSPAGQYVGATSVILGRYEVLDGRFCIEHANVAVPICFAPADLVKVDAY